MSTFSVLDVDCQLLRPQERINLILEVFAVNGRGESNVHNAAPCGKLSAISPVVDF